MYIWHMAYVSWYLNAQIPITGNGHASTHIGISMRTGTCPFTGTGICMYGCVIVRIFFCFSYHFTYLPPWGWSCERSSTSVSTVHYGYWHTPFNASTSNVPCRYWYILVQYQYRHGTLPVLALNGARTDIGIFALLSSTSMCTAHYRYWH